jgi:hypothetical protein
MTSPRIIALCGNPEAGKSEVQKILVERYGAVAIDDGWPMRDFAIRHLGLSYEDVTTQEGKAETVELYGRRFTVRQLLGELGNKLEELFGEDVLALMSAQYLSSHASGKLYCAGSVRRKQGYIWKSIGGVVVKIENPLAKPSGFEFDEFDEGAIDFVIENNGIAWGHSSEVARADLIKKIDAFMISACLV